MTFNINNIVIFYDEKSVPKLSTESMNMPKHEFPNKLGMVNVIEACIVWFIPEVGTIFIYLSVYIYLFKTATNNIASIDSAKYLRLI